MVSIATAITLMLGFGMFIIALINLIIVIINSTKK
ncbi:MULTISPECIES: putative holin-like toxin [Leuconostoc gelidum group]|nr:putative holin-like toxin [Leuconostoc gasicomitatum]MBZ6011247.1 putative holin-like toxin [Leuconostoc gelidum subsp. aenigmaticum]